MEYNSFAYKLTQILTITVGSYTASLIGRFLFGINAPLTVIVVFALLLGVGVFTRFYWLVTAKNRPHIYLTLFLSSLASAIALFVG